MGFDRKLSIKERIKKRRRQRRIRLFIAVSLLVIGIAAIAAFVDSHYHRELMKLFYHKGLANSQTQIDEMVEYYPSDIPDSVGLASSIFYESEPIDDDTYVSDTEDFIEEDSDDLDDIDDDEYRDYDKLKSELEAYVSRFKGQYGIYFVDLVSGYEFGINDTDEYTAASTVKVPLNYYVYKKIESGEVDAQDTIEYIKDDFESGTGILQSKKLEGKSFTIKYLLKLSIVYSDNIATNMLLRHFGRKNLKNFMRTLGGTVVDDNKNVSCPRDMAIYLKEVYQFCNENKELGKEFKNNLCNTVHNDRLPKLLPKDVKVAHKIGDQIQAVHDVGIIYADNPYILAVMSKGVISDEESRNVIAQVSKKVYDFMKRK